jgi:hypothetical protein
VQAVRYCGEWTISCRRPPPHAHTVHCQPREMTGVGTMLIDHEDGEEEYDGQERRQLCSELKHVLSSMIISLSALSPPLCVGFFLRGHPASESDLDDELDDNSDEAEYQKLLQQYSTQEKQTELMSHTPKNAAPPQVKADQSDEPMQQRAFAATETSKKGEATPMEVDPPTKVFSSSHRVTAPHTSVTHPPASFSTPKKGPAPAPASSRPQVKSTAPAAPKPAQPPAAAASSKPKPKAEVVSKPAAPAPAAAAASSTSEKKSHKRKHSDSSISTVSTSACLVSSSTPSHMKSASTSSTPAKKPRTESEIVFLRWEESTGGNQPAPKVITEAQAAAYEKRAGMVATARTRKEKVAYKLWQECGMTYVRAREQMRWRSEVEPAVLRS